MAAYSFKISNNSILASYSSGGVDYTSTVWKGGNSLYGLSGFQSGAYDQALGRLGSEGTNFRNDLEQFARLAQLDDNGNFIDPISDVPNIPTDVQIPAPVDDSGGNPNEQTVGNTLGSIGGTETGSTGGSLSSQVGSQLTSGSGAVNSVSGGSSMQYQNQQLGWATWGAGVYGNTQARQINDQLRGLLDSTGQFDNESIVNQLLNSSATGVAGVSTTKERLNGDMLRRNKGRVDYAATQTLDKTVASALLGTPTLLGN